MTVKLRRDQSTPLAWNDIDNNFESLQNAVDQAVLSSELAQTTGAAGIGADDGSSGSLWISVQGFINKIRSSAGSAVVGFVQAGTGAITRKAQDKLRETVSVMDFGAKGDGVTDDTAAIQAAVNYAASLSGSPRMTVFIPPGNYKTSASIVLASNVQIKGAGRGVSRFLNSFPTGTFTLASSVWIEDILVETGADEASYALVGVDTSYINLHRVDVLGGSFSSTRSKALKITGNTWHTLIVSDCIFDIGSQTGSAVLLQGNSVTPQNADTHFYSVFVDTVLSPSSSCGSVYLQDLFGVHLRGCLIRTSQNGYNVQLTNSGSGTVDAVIEHTSCDYAVTSGKGLLVNTGCTAYLKNSTIDAIYSNGTVVRFEDDAVYTLPGRSKFSWVNQGSSSVQFTSKGESTLIQPQRGAPPNGPSPSLQVCSKPGSVYTMDACISTVGIAQQYNRFGVVWRESSTGKFVAFQILSGSKVAVAKFTNPTTFSEDYIVTGFTPGNKVWMRLSEDSVNRSCWLSSDGTFFVLVHQVAKTDFCTPDQIGWFVDAECQAAPNLGMMATLNSFSTS